MTRQEVLEQVYDVVKKTFKDDTLVLTETTSANDIDGWDSISNLFLIDELENHFKVKLDLDDILNAQNLGDLATAIHGKL